MRLISLPYTLNAETGLVCILIGNRRSLERLSVEDVVRNANGFISWTSKALNLFRTHPEPVDATLTERVWKRRR